jgi:Zn-dependent protease with chaperone function
VTHAVSHGAHYAAVIAVCLLAVTPLSRARWVHTRPGLAVAIWQALLLSASLSVVGLALAVGLAPYGLGELAALRALCADAGSGRTVPLSAGHLAAVVAGLLVAAAQLAATLRYVLASLRARWRHRDVLALVGIRSGAGRGFIVLQHQTPAVYCLPGRRADIVVSAGALRLLTPDQLTAALAHEHAHAAERHDLAVTPFGALRRALPRSRLAARMAAAVEELVEMRADDRAAAQVDPRHLRDALARLAARPSAAIAHRLHRLATPRTPPTGWSVGGIVAAALLVATTPLSLFVVPW